MSHFINLEQRSKENYKFSYSNISPEQLGEEINKLMINDGYILSEGNQIDGIYTKGNRTMRILFGAFVKFFKYRIKCETEGQNSVVQFIKNTTGMSGGLIGMNQVKKEMAQKTELFQLI